MGGPYRVTITNGEIKAENLMKIDGREASIQWNKAVAGKAAMAAILKAEKKVHKESTGNYKLDTGAKTGDISNIQRNDNYVPEYDTDQRYNSKTQKYEDDKYGLTKDSVANLKKKYDVNGLRFKNKAKQFAYHGKKFSVSKKGEDIKVTSGFAMHPEVLKEGLKQDNIKKQTGLDLIDEQIELAYENASEAEQARMDLFKRLGDFSKKGSISELVQYDADHGFIDKKDRKAVHDVFKELLAKRNENKNIADNITDKSKVDLYSIYKKAADPVFRKQYNVAKQNIARDKELLKISKGYDVIGADRFARAFPCYMKNPNEEGLSKEEATARKVHNKNIVEMSASPEGRALIAMQYSKKLLNMDMNMFYAKDFNEAMDKYEQLGQDAQLPFIVQSSVFRDEIEYNPIIAEEIKYNSSSYEEGSYIAACANYLANGGVALFNDMKFDEADRNSLSSAGINTQNTKDYGIIETGIAHLERNSNPGIGETIAELQQQGIIGPNSKYFNAMMEYKNENGETVKERIMFNQGIIRLNQIYQAAKNPDGPQPDFKITFEEKTPEQKKALDEALKTIGKPKPVPNPGPLYGQGLTDQLKEISANLSVIDDEVISGNENLDLIAGRIDDALSEGIETPEQGLQLMQELRSYAQKGLAQHVTGTQDTTTKRAVHSFYTLIKDFAQSKISSIAIKQYAKENNIDISGLYTDKQQPTSNKSIEAKRLDNFANELSKGFAADFKSYSKGKMSAEQLAGTMADILTIRELKNKVMSCKSADELNAFKEACSKDGLAVERGKKLEGIGKTAFTNAVSNLSKTEIEAFLKGTAEDDAYRDFADDVEYNKEQLNPEKQSEKAGIEAIEEENAWLKYEIDQGIETSCKAIAEAREAKDGDSLMQGVAELIAYSSVRSKIRDSVGTVTKLPSMEEIKASAKDVLKELPEFLKNNVDVAKTINEMKVGDKGGDVADRFGDQFKNYAVNKAGGEIQKEKVAEIKENIVNDNPQFGGPDIS